jgi:hypothetical protein
MALRLVCPAAWMALIVGGDIGCPCIGTLFVRLLWALARPFAEPLATLP